MADGSSMMLKAVDLRKIKKLLDQAENSASDCINETAYALSSVERGYIMIMGESE